MRSIEIELNGVTFHARLLEERAPKTCQALWDALPVDFRSTHALWSGNLIYSYDRVPLSVTDLEDPVGFQYPGLVVYHPGWKTIAVCYDDARFRGAAGGEYVTPLAEILGDVAAFGAEAARLQWEGATQVQIRRGELAEKPARPSLSGTQIELELDGVIATATLLEEHAPRTCEVFKSLLPLEGPATNTKWSGEMAHFWGPDRPARGPIGLTIDPVEHPTRFHWPGYVYYHPTYHGIRFAYGDAQQSGAFTTSELTALARFNDDWEPFRQKARDLQLTGTKPMRIRLKS